MALENLESVFSDITSNQIPPGRGSGGQSDDTSPVSVTPNNPLEGSVFDNLISSLSDITQNELTDYGGPYGQGVHGGLTSTFPSLPHREHSAYGDIEENELIRIGPPNSDFDPFSQIQSQETDYSLGTGVFSGANTFEELSKPTRQRQITFETDESTGLKTKLPFLLNPLTSVADTLGITLPSIDNLFGSDSPEGKLEYSQRRLGLVPFGRLGDNPIPTVQKLAEEALKVDLLETFGFDKPLFGKGKINEKLDNLVRTGVDSGKIQAIQKLQEATELPVFRKTPFLGLNPIDKINLTPAVSNKRDDLIAPDRTGDFYVRIKDLRNNEFIYFRGFVTGIVENVSPSFTPVNYIGRSEPVYVYERAERDLSFNLRVYPNNNTEFTIMYDKIDKLTSLAYPNYLSEDGLMRMQPPFTELYMAHIGDRNTGQFGFIKSISYTVNESGDWDALTAKPRLFDIALSYQILSKKPPGLGDRFYSDRKSTGLVQDVADLGIQAGARIVSTGANLIRQKVGGLFGGG